MFVIIIDEDLFNAQTVTKTRNPKNTFGRTSPFFVSWKWKVPLIQVFSHFCDFFMGTFWVSRHHYFNFLTFTNTFFSRALVFFQGLKIPFHGRRFFSFYRIFFNPALFFLTFLTISIRDSQNIYRNNQVKYSFINHLNYTQI